MPITVFKCTYCDKEFAQEQACIDHEATHAHVADCTKVYSNKKQVDAKLHILHKGDWSEMRLSYGENKPRTEKWIIKTESLYATQPDGNVELVDDIGEIK